MKARSVSIVINNCNYGRFLGVAIESALAQHHPNTEVIVVDDGSSDNSREVIAGYAGRVRPLLKVNAGQGSAFNAGYALSRGDVICFLDADDALLPDAMARAVPAFDDPSCVQAHWTLTCVDQDGKELGRIIPEEPLSEGDLMAHFLADGPAACVTSPTSGNAWARHYLAQVLPLPEDAFPFAADSYLSSLSPLYGKRAKIAGPQALRRIHSDSSLLNRPYKQRLALIEKRYKLLGNRLEALAIDPAPDLARWKARDPFFQFVKQMTEIGEALARFIEPQQPYILIDMGHWASGALLEANRSIPFLEKNGVYWGPPDRDETAIAEVQRQKAAGARYLVFGSPAFWWFDHYAGFLAYIQANCTYLGRTEDFILYDLERHP